MQLIMAWKKKDYDNDAENLLLLANVNNLQQLDSLSIQKGYKYKRFNKMAHFLYHIKDLEGIGLELAFGFGESLAILFETYPKLIMDCFDFSRSVRKLIPIFKSEYPRIRHIWVGRCEQIPIKNNQYDFINAQSIFEHLNNEQFHLTLQECFRVLKPNGIMGVWVDQGNDGKQHIRCKPHNLAAKEISKYGFKPLTDHIFRKE